MIWLNPDQLKDIGVTTAMLRHNRTKWEFRPTALRGRNGKPIREVSLESLPVDLQRNFLKSQHETETSSLITESHHPAEVGPADGDAASSGLDGERRLTESLTRYDPNVREAFLQEAQRLAEIIDRYDSVNPKRQKAANGKYEFTPAVSALCEEAICADRTVLAVEPKRATSPSPHTIDKWSKDFKREGLAAFLRKPPEKTAETDKRQATISDEAVQWMQANWRSKPSAWALYKELKKVAAKKRWSIPAYGWVWRKYSELPKIVRSVAFEGEKRYAAKWGVYVPRTVEDLTALQILCGDHSVRDVTVMLPDGQLTRPWLTVWQCLRTGLIWGWHLDLTPSSNTIGLAYVNGVQNFGAQPMSRPDDNFYSYLYTDQGKDYRCKTIAGQTLEFKQAAKIEGGLGHLCTQRKVGFMHELGIKHFMARGYNGKEKAVERLFADISRWEQNTFSQEYCGRGTEHKPDAWVKAWHKHKRLLKKFEGNLHWLQGESPFMTLDDYRDNLGGWINEYNHESHTRTVLRGSKVVPVDEYNRLYTTKYEISDDTLAILLMKADRKKIGKNGITMFSQKFQFIDPAMTQFKGEWVEVRYSEGDYSRVWVVLPNGEVVETQNLTRSPILNPNKHTMEAVARQKTYERKVIREHRLIQQGNWNGQTVEDRVAQMINPDEPQAPEQQKMAVNARPVVHAMNRFDRPKLSSGGRSGVTTDQIENANVIEGLFGEIKDKKPRIKEEWED